MLRVSILLLAAAVLTAAVPVQSLDVPAVPAAEPMVAWLRSDGTSGITPFSQFQEEGNLDAGTQVCSGIAPLESTCVRTDTSGWPFVPGGGWTIGLYLPSHPLTSPSGAFFGSVIINLTGSKSVVGCCWSVVNQPTSLFFGCNFFLTTSAYGVIIAGDVNCRELYPRIYTPTGDLTATFHAGALDPRIPGNFYGAIPADNEDEYGVGTWAGFITVRG